MTPSRRGRPGHVRGVIFDLDGTLVDGYDAITTGVNAARRHFGLAALRNADVRRRVGLGLSHLMTDVLGAARAEEGAAVFRRAYDAACVPETRAVPLLAPTLATIREHGFRMAVASNKPVSFSVRILHHLGVTAYFDLVAGPETAGAIKPDPRMLQACLQAMATRADEAIYVGDMTLDADSGNRAGVQVVLVSGGSSTAEELAATGCPVLGSLADLLAWLPPTPTG